MKLKERLYFSLLAVSMVMLFSNCGETSNASKTDTIKKATINNELPKPVKSDLKAIDTLLYDSLMNKLANGDTTGKWPVKKAVYPLPGAILPFKRIVAFYGNLYSRKMGILGELPPKEMLAKLDKEVATWEKADPETPVQPALHYIAVVAQGSGGKDGKYRTRMPDKQIDSVLFIAKMRNAIVFLDIQVALSTIKSELPALEKYLKLPHVHLGIDPEFSMNNGDKPGTRIGTYDAADINYCSNYLADLVRDNNLPPKVLVVHRFTKKMVTNSKDIQLRPEVQLIMHMDGWGQPELKKGTYRHWIYAEPVQFTGFKLFYKNDIKKAPNRLLTAEELLKLKPKPVYIQYQ
ncbi:MAG: hypothetical protein ACOH2A_11650 [Sphingobacteriaceae bacterium]